MGLNILYEDEELLVVKKDAGIPVQAGKLRMMDLQGLMKRELFKRNPAAGEPYLGMIHRLDQPVEGILVFAKTPKAAAELSRQVTDGRMKKLYLARVLGKLPGEKGTLVDYLKKDGRTNTSMVVSKGEQDAKRSELNYRVLETDDATSLIEIELLTGRHHQIRVQMAHAGCPLVGDRKYNPNPSQAETWEFPALCAYRLTFVHPKTKQTMSYAVTPDHPALLTEKF